MRLVCAFLTLGLFPTSVLGAQSVRNGFPLSAGRTARVSVGSNGEQGNQKSYVTSVSARARFVVFASGATGLVPGDTNSAWDVFLRDRENGTTELISVSSSGVQGNGNSANGTISDDGRFVVFDSDSTNLTALPSGGGQDVYLRDRLAGTTVLLSDAGSGPAGGYGPELSPDGRFVTFHTNSMFVAADGNSLQDIYLLDRSDGSFDLISVSSSGAGSNNWSLDPALTPDGRYLAFTSAASNLVAGDTNGWEDVFVRDRDTGTTTRVSVDSAGNQGNVWSASPTISADGRFVAFCSASTNLAPLDTNSGWDLFLHDRSTATTTLVSVNTAGVQGNNWSGAPTLSSDGRYLSFHSNASNYDAGAPAGWHVYVRDLVDGRTLRATTAATTLLLLHPLISSDGRFVCFNSPTPFVPADTNGQDDVYIRWLF